ncbi:S1/P1 Nuclease [Pseudochryseolinea flava]|uniref:S1/P1 Nuclease n=2 Tax=Pseudochryseolinea flava TaxID=2059302 RepID=A0A364XZS7_9BACT|nr:S1/P1 Nuclease [Pseudochryseolinea flava]
MNKLTRTAVLLGIIPFLCSFWGFFAHQRINKLAVFTLPPGMIKFYKKNLTYITEAAVNPDRRRFSMPEEAPRHYIDIDHYGDSALYTIPRYWDQAVEKYSEDTLKAYGIVPWHINKMYYQLKHAFLVGDPDRILKLSAELGHYIGDAHVPLHTTENYNGQLTGQEGIHAFWESRLPELFSDDYDYYVGKATYLENPQAAAWNAVIGAHHAVDSVLREEKKLSQHFGEKKFAFETKGKQTQKVLSRSYAKAYHQILDGMIERQMRSAIKTVGSFWYTAWIDAGQPDLERLLDYHPTEEELERRREELRLWKEKKIQSRAHESDTLEIKN